MATDLPKSVDELPTSEVKFVGKEVKRIEDPGLVTGNTEFIDNFSSKLKHVVSI